MPERMTRSAPVPSSSVNCRSFLDLGTATHSFTFTARKSDLLNVSKSTSSSNSGSIDHLREVDGSGRGLDGSRRGGGSGSLRRDTRVTAGCASQSPHVRKRQHVADGRGVGEQHGQAVDADAAGRPPGGMPYSRART